VTGSGGDDVLLIAPEEVVAAARCYPAAARTTDGITRGAITFGLRWGRRTDQAMTGGAAWSTDPVAYPRWR
jgi:hypothetical protein